MPFLDRNSHLRTKLYNCDIKRQSNSESYDWHNFFGTKIRGGQNFLLIMGGFYNEKEYSGADWLVPLSTNLVKVRDKIGLEWAKWLVISIYIKKKILHTKSQEVSSISNNPNSSQKEILKYIGSVIKDRICAKVHRSQKKTISTLYFCRSTDTLGIKGMVKNDYNKNKYW